MGVNRSSGPARAWYPSGPRIDGSKSEASVGVGFQRLSVGSTSDPRNPDPKNFSIVESQQVGDVFVTKINYPNCTTYEGNKIIVSDFNPKRRKTLDPHFTENSGIIARFAPTHEGWQHAVNFAHTIRK